MVEVMVLYIGIIQISKKCTRHTFQTCHTCLECIFDVNDGTKYGRYRGKILRYLSFFGTLTIEVYRYQENFNPFHCLGGGKC
jgi:polyferredoxin